MSDDAIVDSSARILGLKRKALEQINLLLDSGLSPKRTKDEDLSIKRYRERLATFHAGKWQNGKELNPRRLAERGWRAVDSVKKTVKCDGCGYYLCTELPVITKDIHVYQRCLRKMFESLDTCHEKTCLAKARRPNFFPYFNEKSELMGILNARLEKMKEVKILNDKIEITEDGVDTMSLINIFPDETDVRLKMLAVTGWEKYDSSSVRCSLCLRCMRLDVSFVPSSCHHSWCPNLDLHDTLDIPQWRVPLHIVSHKSPSSLEESLRVARKTLKSSFSVVTSTLTN